MAANSLSKAIATYNRDLEIAPESPDLHGARSEAWLYLGDVQRRLGKREVSDFSRTDVLRGGITGARKTAIVREAYAARCEIHMSGIGNLHVVAATHEDTSLYYERGLLAPGVDYDATLPYRRESLDGMDSEGYVHPSQRPGFGYDIDWEYIEANKIEG